MQPENSKDKNPYEGLTSKDAIKKFENQITCMKAETRNVSNLENVKQELISLYKYLNSKHNLQSIKNPFKYFKVLANNIVRNQGAQGISVRESAIDELEKCSTLKPFIGILYKLSNLDRERTSYIARFVWEHICGINRDKDYLKTLKVEDNVYTQEQLAILTTFAINKYYYECTLTALEEFSKKELESINLQYIATLHENIVRPFNKDIKQEINLIANQNTMEWKIHNASKKPEAGSQSPHQDPLFPL